MHTYVYLHISEMNDSSDTRDRREELAFFFFVIRYSHYLLSGKVSLETGFQLAVNIHCKL